MMADNGTRDEDLELLLPWYVNGTLDAKERAEVEAYLERSGHARDEVELLRALRQQVKDEKIENSPGELGLQRLKREIRQDAEQRKGSADRMTGKVITVASFWRPLAIAACLAVVIQAGVMVGINSGIIPGGEVTTAGKASAVLQVTFAPDATEQDIREVLQSAGASIADGPTALGIYNLRLVDPATTTVEEALATLRANTTVVTFAERN